MDDGKEVPGDQTRPTAWAASSGWVVVKKIVRIVVGVVLIILGLVALVTPFTPGSWLALIGLEFLGLRVLLRNRMCTWSAAKPSSRFRKMMCRVFGLDGLDALKRRWRGGPKSPR
jgi:sulfite exporter TauE/SafE